MPPRADSAAVSEQAAAVPEHAKPYLDFERSLKQEPHLSRRLAILEAHPEVRGGARRS